jgi:septal ring factor EnvC (AmiA/AmiB activator)
MNEDTGPQIASLQNEVTKGIEDLKSLSGNILNVTTGIESTTNQILKLQGKQAELIQNVESLNQLAPGQRIPQSGSVKFRGGIIFYYLIFSAAKGVVE